MKEEEMNMNKKYLPSALILYLNYFIHGIGCSILSQQLVKELLAEQWGMSDVMGVTAVAAALGLGRLISLPFAGPLSDKFGRRISVLIGCSSYVIFFVGIAFSPNMTVAYVAAVLVLAAYLLFRKNKYDGERLTIRAVDAAGRRAALK